MELHRSHKHARPGRSGGRVTVFLVTLLIFGLATQAAMADNPHFVGSPTITKSTTSGLTISGKIAGLGTIPDDVFLTASAVEATYECVNKGGNVAPGQPLVFEDVQGPSGTIEPSGGNIVFTATLPVPPTPSARDVCPNGNWSVRLLTLTYFDVVLHVQKPAGTDVFTHDFGDIDP